MQERRLYQRGSHFYTLAKISNDKKTWKEIGIADLSSGGLQLYTDDLYKIGDLVWFHLLVQGFFSEFEFDVQGAIKREKLHDGHHIYGVSFVGLSEDLKIVIDENVRNDRPIGGSTNSLN